jgi:hypothetical protein
MQKLFKLWKSSTRAGEQLKLVVKTDRDQAKLTMMIIASSTAGFLLLCAGIAMVFMSSDYDETAIRHCLAAYAAK